MAYGRYRRYPPYYKSPRRRIHTQRRGATAFILPDPSVLEGGKRKHFYFDDYDGVTIRIQALAGDFIKFGTTTSISGGWVTSTANGASCHVVAVNDTTWKVIGYTLTWSVT